MERFSVDTGRRSGQETKRARHPAYPFIPENHVGGGWETSEVQTIVAGAVLGSWVQPMKDETGPPPSSSYSSGLDRGARHTYNTKNVQLARYSALLTKPEERGCPAGAQRKQACFAFCCCLAEKKRDPLTPPSCLRRLKNNGFCVVCVCGYVCVCGWYVCVCVCGWV